MHPRTYEIEILTGSKDLSGHPVNFKGYLTNANGDIVNRQGQILFREIELKNGEFPKIFKFSKLDMKTISGSFKRD